MKRFVLFTVFFALTLTIQARPRIIYFQTELTNATYIRFVTVLDYTDTTMSAIQVSTGDTLEFRCSGKRTADNMRNIIKPESSIMEGRWPAIGDRVLILADSSMEVRLLAVKKEKDYQFWNPNMDLLGSWFSFQKPARPTQYCLEKSPYPEYQDKDCFDGCLYSAELITER